MMHSSIRDPRSRGKIAFLYRGYENIGIQYLSAVLRQAGFSTRLFFDPELFDDWILRVPRLIRAFDYSGHVIDETAAWKPDLILFSVVTYDYLWAKQLASRLKERLDAPIVFGGIHATSVPEKVLENPFVDFVVQGEGEEAVVKLAEHVMEGASLETVPNLWSRGNGQVHAPGQLVPLLQDLDAIPFPDKELHINASEHFRIGYTAVSGRGCPNNCTYCHNNIQRKIYPLKGYLRRRSPENVIDELSTAKMRYGFDFVRFSDDNFCYDVNWLEAFAPLYAEKVNLPFWIFIHPSTSNTRIVKALKQAGCVEVEMGIQTLNRKVREDVIQRNETEAEIIEAMRLLRKEGIRCTTDFIINLPGHDEEALVDAIRFFQRHTPSRVNTFWINYYPRLDITRMAMEEGAFTDGIMESICQGEGVHTFFQGGTVYTEHLARLQIFFTLLQVLPKGFLEKFLRRRFYRRIPFFGFKITYFLMYVVSYLSPEEKNDLYLRRFKMRYRKYAIQKLKKAVRLNTVQKPLKGFIGRGRT